MFNKEKKSKMLELIEADNVMQCLELGILNFTGLELLALLSKVRDLDEV